VLDGNDEMGGSGDCIDLTQTDDEEPVEDHPSRPASAAGSCKSSYSLSSDSTITGSEYNTGLNSSSVYVEPVKHT